jgi:hypothetical protein
MDLRPLAFGELFDRAITLYVRNLVPFAAIVFVLMLPLAIVRYFYDASQAGQIDRLFHELGHPRSLPQPLLHTPQGLALVVIATIVAYLFLPFVLNAVAVGVARLYQGRPVEFRVCYAASLRRWPNVFGVILLGLGILIAWHVAVASTGVVMAMLAGSLLVFSHAAGIAAVVLVTIAILAMIFTIIPVVLALTFAMYAAVIEEKGAASAVASGIGRIFARKEFWRAVLFALASGAIGLGGSMLISGFTLVALVLHQIAIGVFVETLLETLILPFSAVLMAVYYFDVRIRREGFDLEIELARLTPGASAQQT